MKYIKLTVLFFSFLLASCSADNVAQVSTGSANNVKVILMAGQSNMGGAGDFDALPAKIKERLQLIQSRVMYSNNGSLAKPLAGTYSSYQLKRRGFSNTFGPELLAGITLAEGSPKSEFLLIKTAMGGTTLFGAWNPNWNAENSALVEKGEKKRNIKLFQQHIDNIKRNLEQLERRGKTYEIVGMFWMQGENDAARKVAAISYESNLNALISGVRTNLNLPKMPFVIGQINSTYGKFKPGPTLVRQAMNNVAEKDNNVTIIETSTDSQWLDYPKHSDNVHYNTVGLSRLGKAFANELSLMSLSN